MDVAIVSAIYDNYDTVKPPLDQFGGDYDVEWIMVTDDSNLVAPGWRVVVEPRSGVHPNRAAKRPKMLPWLYAPTAEYSIWLDASYQVISRHLVIDLVTRANPIAQFTHPWRACVYAEAEESVKLQKYKGQPCLRQVARYRERGFPAGWGLWATGVIARKHTPEIKNFGEHWLYECENYSFQDQLSHPYCLYEAVLRPSSLPGNHLVNKWLSYQGSGRH